MAADVQRYDVKLDANGDLDFGIFGDFTEAPSDTQHIIDTINAAPGTWKEYIDTGVNIRYHYGGATDPQQITKSTKVQLELDGYVCAPKALLSSDGTLYLSPNVTLNDGQTNLNPIIPLS